MSAAQLLEEKYEHWKLNKSSNGHVTLFSPPEKRVLKVSYDTIHYSNELTENTSELQKHIETVYKAYVKESNVNVFTHIGYRSIQILESDLKAQELAEVIFEKFYNQQGDIRKISADDIGDTVFILDGVKDGHLNHVKIGPTRKDEAIAYFNSAFELDSSRLETDCYLYVDIDVYKGEGVNKDNALQILEKNISINKNITEQYIEYISK